MAKKNGKGKGEKMYGMVKKKVVKNGKKVVKTKTRTNSTGTKTKKVVKTFGLKNNKRSVTKKK